MPPAAPRLSRSPGSNYTDGARNSARPARTVQALAQLEVRSTELLREYAQLGFDLCEMIATEFDTTASEIQMRISGSRGKVRGWSVHAAARRSVRSLRRAASDVDSAKVHLSKFYKEYRREFEELITPDKGRGGWAFREDGKDGKKTWP